MNIKDPIPFTTSNLQKHLEIIGCHKKCISKDNESCSLNSESLRNKENLNNKIVELFTVVFLKELLIK